ncbi:MAG: hypothetical protein ACQEQ1_03575, partial [Pseudomonadota bacterium]
EYAANGHSPEQYGRWSGLMKTRLCFRAYTAPLAVLLSFTLVGCDLESSSEGETSTCLDEFRGPNSANATVSTFNISDTDESPFGAKVERTILHQLAKFSEPSQGTASKDKADRFYSFLENRLNERLSIGSLPAYKQVRSRSDLLEAMATSGEPMFEEVRETLANCVREDSDSAGSITTAARITEKPDSESESTTSWRYAIAYNYNPSVLDVTAIGPNIRRLILSENTTLVSFYQLDKFTGKGSVSGFKRPVKLSLGLGAPAGELIGQGKEDSDNNDENSESMIFESSLPESNEEEAGTDLWSWSVSSDKGTDHFAASDNISCVRAQADYSNGTVEVKLSETSCPSINSSSEQAEWEPDETFSYESASPEEPQRRGL